MAHKYQNTKALLRIHEYFDKIKLEMTNDEIMNYKFGINKQLNTKVILERLKKYPIEVQQTSSVVTINDKVDWKVVKEIIFEKMSIHLLTCTIWESVMKMKKYLQHEYLLCKGIQRGIHTCIKCII